jgi:eukaryotic-like serine/threonine-protein kinase
MSQINAETNPKATIGQSILEGLFDEEVSSNFSENATETLTFDDLFEETATSETKLMIGRNPVDEHSKRFDYVNDLGEGAYGKVWKADDTAIGRTVAVKSYKFTGSKGAKLITMETSIVGKIDHPGVPVLYDIQQSEDGLYHYIMKYVEGETLEDVIERLRQGDEETTKKYTHIHRSELMLQVLRTLSNSHSKGIIHRDIKPENIMIGLSGEAYLMDWGIALDLSEHNGKGQLAGTPRYMSPEQAQALEIDHRSDLFSLAGVLYEFISLDVHGPKTNKTKEILEQIPKYSPTKYDLATPYTGTADYPITYLQIFLKGLQLDPKDRYQSADEFIEDLENGMNGDIDVSCVFTFTYSILKFLQASYVKRPVHTFLSLWIGIGLSSSLLVYIGTLL